MDRKTSVQYIRHQSSHTTILKNIYFLIIVATLVWYKLCISQMFSDENPYHYEESTYKLNSINDSADQKLCYKNFVFNEYNERLRFMDMVDDEVLKTSDSQNIIFHLTNCIHDGIPKINLRQACAVESAARSNPHLNIFLAFAAPIGFVNKTELPIMNALMSYKNVRIRNNDITRYAEGTILEDWIKEGKIYQSQHFLAHVSDYLRFVSLFKYGGLYMDLDTITVKNVSYLGRNYAGPQHDVDNTVIANGVMNFDPKSEIGHLVGLKCLEDVLKYYNPDSWAANGPDAITRVVSELCHTPWTEQMTYERCGFQIYHMTYFYGITWYFFNEAFETDPEKIEKMMDILKRKNTTILHFQNNFSKDYLVPVINPVAYTILAEMYCPRIFQLSEIFF